MPQSSHDARQHILRTLAQTDLEALEQRLSPKHHPLPARVPGASLTTAESVARRWKNLGLSAETSDALWDPATAQASESFHGHIENLIGTVKVPVGVAGPLRVNGVHAQGDYFVPLATTEAALVASYHRGAVVLSESGGCTALLISEGISRAPGFAFANLIEAGRFVAWAVGEVEKFREIAAGTTRHGSLTDLRFSVEGNHVYLVFEYLTGDAAGQNMVTIATQAICDYINTASPVKPEYSFVESNLSGDKKASAQSFQAVRGKKVSAEVVVPAALLEKRLHTSAARMTDYWRMSAVGGVLSGTIGVQGHYANGLAALYIACGQDAACVSESAVGVTRFEERPDGALYAAVTLPNLIVGTVGGGTSLPSQRACLEILGLYGTGHARALAEVTAALCLAGEISIIAALSCQEFTRAHRKLARDHS
ncbi:MAG TPA: hydroxymethylglutaryl-CoA reductase [Chthoniobacterales bacterium]|jgi:hydroxymethylglutaryl-CoA reductase (NADPH)